ncbi:NADP-dependent oxidoreductase [Nocardia cyriacigeorgica]|uniref:NADP-dependent oxidoreductase n=1 Tax=Nocardia cyriacigeorgica TaxID=135487 RepID=UPI0024559F35|nr:NADP-dependent oxidoreductase [Nocardia cyriacigeorgica]
MRAIGQDTLGGPEVLRIVEAPKPAPGPGEVLVRVHAAAVNPTDAWHRMAGGLAGGVAEPIRLGWDVSGVVEQVGLGVTLFAPGDEVFGVPRHPLPAGAYAEYLTSPARHLVAKPTGLSHVQAAALPLAALTAWQAVVDVAEVGAGDRVLVHAAGGGVGHLAVQIAKARGAYVIGTASAGKHELVRELGADAVIDYASVDFADVVTGIDAVIDTVGGAYGPRSLRVLRPGGIVVSLASPAELALAEPAAAQGKRAVFMIVESDQHGLREIAALAADGRLRPVIDTVLPLSEAARAHELIASGHTTGKVVLSVIDAAEQAA